MKTGIIDLQKLAYMSGTFCCPKCSCTVNKRTISMVQGEIGTTQKDRVDPQLCPNGCGIMEPETYKNVCKNFNSQIDELYNFIESKNLMDELHESRRKKKVPKKPEHVESPSNKPDFGGMSQHLKESTLPPKLPKNKMVYGPGFKCKICDEKFPTATSLDYHRIEDHGLKALPFKEK